jgi:hypothetical protein
MLRDSAIPSSTIATSRRRTIRPVRSATTSSPKSSTRRALPWVVTDHSRRLPTMRPLASSAFSRRRLEATSSMERS